MYLCIGIAVWVVLGLVNLRMELNADGNRSREWVGGDTMCVVFGFIAPPILIGLNLCIYGKDCFRRRNLYWSEKQQQIMTMGGKCLYDKGDFGRLGDLVISHKDGLDEDMRVMEKAGIETYNKVIAINQCSAKTKGKHKMVYEKKRELDMSPCALNYSSIVTHPYIFKCSICNLEITKTNKELAKAEREHLTGLGVSKKGK